MQIVTELFSSFTHGKRIQRGNRTEASTKKGFALSFAPTAANLIKIKLA